MDLFVRYKDYKEAWNKFKAFRGAVFSLLMENPTLGGAAGVVQGPLLWECLVRPGVSRAPVGGDIPAALKQGAAAGVRRDAGTRRKVG